MIQTQAKPSRGDASLAGDHNTGGRLVTFNDYTADQIRVADIYDRFEEHIKLYDKPVRNDKWIWRVVDEMTPEQLLYLLHFAKDNQYWNIEIDSWIDEVCDRNPFWIRQSKDKMKSRHNNNMIWKIMMLAREVMKEKIKQQNDPKNVLFYNEKYPETENVS